MEKSLKGRVIKGVGGTFKVDTGNGIKTCYARGLFKREENSILVGDYVKIVKDHEFIITEVEPRKNFLIRPPIANIDTLVIVVAVEPEPDYVLVDKLLLTAFYNDVEPVICVNKSELSSSVFDYLNNTYSDFCKVFSVSAVLGMGLDALKDNLKGTVCFAGQSAVGKTSLLNAFCEISEQTGGLSKINRGRNTTRHIQIYKVNDKFDIVDTCGFSKLEAGMPPKGEIALYYPDFVKLGTCKFRGCFHYKEPECVVIDAVKNNILDKSRYERYLSLIDVPKYGGKK